MRWGFWFQLGVTLMACTFLVLPAAYSVLTGLTANYFRGLSSGLTTAWLVQVWVLYADTVWRSMAIALGTLAVTLVIGVPGAWALQRRPGWLSRAIEEVVSLPLAVPGLALALALLQLYGTMRGFRVSSWFILVGHVLYTLPFMLRAVMAVMAATPGPANLFSVANGVKRGPAGALAGLIFSLAGLGIFAFLSHLVSLGPGAGGNLRFTQELFGGSVFFQLRYWWYGVFALGALENLLVLWRGSGWIPARLAGLAGSVFTALVLVLSLRSGVLLDGSGLAAALPEKADEMLELANVFRTMLQVGLILALVGTLYEILEWGYRLMRR